MALILVVDPNPPERRIIRMTLELDGHRLAEAATDVEALDLVRHTAFDVVFLAIGAQEPEAHRLAHDLITESRGDSTSIITVVDPDDERGPVEAFMAGAIDVLVRPVSPSGLRLAVERAMSTEELERRRAMLGTQLEAYEVGLRLHDGVRHSSDIP